MLAYDKRVTGTRCNSLFDEFNETTMVNS